MICFVNIIEFLSFFLHFSVFCLHFGVTLYPKKDNCIHEYKDKRI